MAWHAMAREGLNNVFLIETSHELALRYNDSWLHGFGVDRVRHGPGPSSPTSGSFEDLSA